MRMRPELYPYAYHSVWALDLIDVVNKRAISLHVIVSHGIRRDDSGGLHVSRLAH